MANKTKEIKFVNQYKPPLKDGSYTLDINHKLTYGSETKDFSKKHTFEVCGQRFKLDPHQVHKAFPPANKKGHFDNVLPHIVLNRRTLPWERSVGPNSPDASWLALLVLDQSIAPKPVTGTLADLYPGTTKEGNGTLPGDIHSYGSAAKAGDAFLQTGEKSTDACVYIDIDPGTFEAYAPALADLKWNAHARDITKEDGSVMDYSVVVAHCLPIPGSASVVHLVSLEGQGDQLPPADGKYPNPPAWEKIRLVSLKSWSFKVDPIEASFADLLQGLNGGSQGGQELGDSQLRFPAGYTPVASPTGAPTLPFGSGYTVLSDSADTKKSSWYHGPLTPSVITPSAADSGWSSDVLPADPSGSLKATVKTTPNTDVSHAAAWQLGQLLALADQKFSSNQLNWKNDLRRQLNRHLSQNNKDVQGSRAAYAQKIRTTLADANALKTALGKQLSTASDDDAMLIRQDLVDWMGNLALLDKVPFHYLVPDMKMCPPESLKFFNIDPQWIACLLDGAWSIGREPKSQWAIDTAYQPWQQLQAGTLKNSWLAEETCWPQSGILLNSSLVKDYWPGVEFIPTPDATVLREARLGPDTVLLLFDQALTSLEIRQPAEGIHFGFDMTGIGQLSKQMRYLEVNNTTYPTPPQGQGTPGTEVPGKTLASIPQRLTGVIQLDQLAQDMTTALGVPSANFTAAQLALELVESVAAATFNLPKQN